MILSLLTEKWFNSPPVAISVDTVSVSDSLLTVNIVSDSVDTSNDKMQVMLS